MLSQPSWGARITAKTSAPSAMLKVTRPTPSARCARGLRDSRTRNAPTNSAAMPAGTLMKKIHRQDSASVSSPPISGPVATASPTAAPKAVNAVARAFPWNS